MGPNSTLGSVVKEILQTALISFGIFFVVYIFLVQPHRIKGESMVPNFTDGELILSEKIGYKLDEPRRGDVVVFRAPAPAKVDFIKRIVGVPGEKVTISNGEVHINGQKLEEPYEIQITEGRVDLQLGENQYFVLGDNRRSSSDSRTFGPIYKNSIKGRAWIVYWPIFSNENSKGKRVISRIRYSISNSF